MINWDYWLILIIFEFSWVNWVIGINGLDLVFVVVCLVGVDENIWLVVDDDEMLVELLVVLFVDFVIVDDWLVVVFCEGLLLLVFVWFIVWFESVVVVECELFKFVVDDVVCWFDDVVELFVLVVVEELVEFVLVWLVCVCGCLILIFNVGFFWLLVIVINVSFFVLIVVNLIGIFVCGYLFDYWIVILCLLGLYVIVRCLVVIVKVLLFFVVYWLLLKICFICLNFFGLFKLILFGKLIVFILEVVLLICSLILKCWFVKILLLVVDFVKVNCGNVVVWVVILVFKFIVVLVVMICNNIINMIIIVFSFLIVLFFSVYFDVV